MERQNKLVFNGVSAQQFAALAVKARGAGIALESNTGRAMKFGAEVAWNYQPEGGQLTLECLQTPFFLSPEAVLAELEAMVRASLA
jgi:hypothetical protein